MLRHAQSVSEAVGVLTQGRIPEPVPTPENLSDVGCCVVASSLTGRQRLADVILLARDAGQLFGQPAIVPYRFRTALADSFSSGISAVRDCAGKGWTRATWVWLC